MLGNLLRSPEIQSCPVAFPLLYNAKTAYIPYLQAIYDLSPGLLDPNNSYVSPCKGQIQCKIGCFSSQCIPNSKDDGEYRTT